MTVRTSLWYPSRERVDRILRMFGDSGLRALVTSWDQDWIHGLRDRVSPLEDDEERRLRHIEYQTVLGPRGR